MTNNGEQNQAPMGMAAITISREYGSGGGEIAARLADRLGWKLVDHEVVVQVAQAMGVSEDDAALYDEHVDGFVARLISSLGVIQPPVSNFVPSMMPSDSDAYDRARRQAVLAAAQAGHVVIVGRGGQILLSDRRDVLHVRIVSSMEERIEYVMRRENLDQATAQSRIQSKDRDRQRFLAAEHHRSPEDIHLYDIVLNTSVIDLDSIVDILALALERKGAQLSRPVADLGPSTGLSTYPTPPGNFGAPDNSAAVASEA